MELGSYLTRGSVWQREKDHVVMCKHILRRLTDRTVQQRNQLWVVLPKESSRTGTCCQCANFYFRMAKQQTEKLSACITCGPCHSYPYRHSHEYAMHDNFMHVRVSRFDAVIPVSLHKVPCAAAQGLKRGRFASA